MALSRITNGYYYVRLLKPAQAIENEEYTEKNWNLDAGEVVVGLVNIVDESSFSAAFLSIHIPKPSLPTNTFMINLHGTHGESDEFEILQKVPAYSELKQLKDTNRRNKKLLLEQAEKEAA